MGWFFLLLLIGLLFGAIQALRHFNAKKVAKLTLPPHRDNNAKWDDEED